MSTIINNNLIVLGDFQNDVLAYENHLLTNNYFPAALSLKSALDRMIISCPLDAFQMMRYLANRMSVTAYYTDNILLQIADVSVGLGGSDLVINILYKLRQVENGIPFNHDELWYSSVNFNVAIKMFMTTYTSSDLYMLRSVNKNNLVESSNVVTLIKGAENDAVVTLSLGKDNFDVSLTAFQKQKLKVTVDPSLSLPESYDTSIPLTILSKVSVKAGIKEFFLDKTVTIPESTLCIFELFPEYLDKTTVNLGNRTFKFPNHFYSYELDLISFNSGDTWVLGNIVVNGPSL